MTETVKQGLQELRIEHKPQTPPKIVRYCLADNLVDFRRKHVAVYARVSRKSELKHHSIEAQMENLEMDVQIRPNWEFVGCYVDEGITGTRMNRPAFNRLIDDARSGKIDIILTKSVSRFGRNYVEVQRLLRELKSLGVAVIFDSEHLDTSSDDGMFTLQCLSIQAEEEARQTSKNQKWSKRNGFKQGIPSCTSCPYGYKMVEYKVQIIPDEANVVKHIYNMFLDGKGKGQIAKTLSDEGIPTRAGGNWRSSTILDILTNPCYVGDLLLQKWYTPNFLTKINKRNDGALPQYLIPDNHEAIIDRATYDKVQAEIERRRKLYSPGRSWAPATKLFSGIIRCGHCNSSVSYKHVARHNRDIWACRVYIELGPKRCPTKAIPERVLIDATYKVLQEQCLIKDGTPLSNDLLKKLILIIIAHEDKTLEFRLQNGETVFHKWEFISRSKSWTPEMREEARMRSLRRNNKHPLTPATSTNEQVTDRKEVCYERK